MSVYLDTSVVVPLLVQDHFSARAETLLTAGAMDVVVSDFTAAEFASVMGVRRRSRILSIAQATKALSNFDSWIKANAAAAETLPTDMRDAGAMLQRLDMTLRMPDAVHIAIARRLGAELATFDMRVAADARALGERVVVPA